MLSDSDFEQLCEYCNLPAPVFPNYGDEALPVLTELELTQLMQARSEYDLTALNFQADGCYHNFIPAVVKAERLPSLLSSSQWGSSSSAEPFIRNKMAALTGMPFCWLVPDDRVTVLARLLIATVSDNKQGRTQVLIPATISPLLRSALRTQLKFQPIDLVVVDYDKTTGRLSRQQLEPYDDAEIAAIVLAWPNYFGVKEDIAAISDWASNKDSVVIGLSDPLMLSYLGSPFELAEQRLDYLIGDFQAMGLSASQQAGAPSFVAARDESTAMQGSEQGLNYLRVIHAYLSFGGQSALQQSAERSSQRLVDLLDRLSQVAGVSLRFSSPVAGSCVIRIAQIELDKALKILSGHNMVFGCRLQDDFPELEDCLLISCSDQHTPADVEKLHAKVVTVVKNLSTAGCPIKPKF